MCGIVGYIGKKEAIPGIIGGLKALEYRGYDSAGLAVIDHGTLTIVKVKGYVENLQTKIQEKTFRGTIALGHTRWATHGVPNETNAHPHTDCQNRIAVVHNGIIENYRPLKEYLQKKGHRFASETDTEVVAHLLEDFLKNGKTFREALYATLHAIEGAYALGILHADDEMTLYAARKSSPLVIGVGEGEYLLASDPAALVQTTHDVVYLKDGEVAEIHREGLSINNLERSARPVEVEKLEWTLEQAQKGNFPHFMLKEIFEGPDVVRAALSGRLKTKEKLVKLGGLESVRDRLQEMKRLVLLACGTSYYAGLVGEYLFEEVSGIPTEVHFASEFRYRKEPFEAGTVAIAISQSGETADTLGALEKAKEHGLLTLGIVNVVGSSIARTTDAGVYNHAGPEIGVASTKAFLSQLTILTLMALYFSKERTELHDHLMTELEKIPEKMAKVLESAGKVQKLAKQYVQYENFLFLGRRYNYPVALEGALKLKEISYIHAEGYGAGEMKHGPIALISPQFPTIAIVPQDSVSDKMRSNIEEIRSRRGPLVAIASENDKTIEILTDHILQIPRTLEPLEPLLTVIPLQLFAYYVGTMRGHNVDKPRNLAKSVTVE